MKFRQNPATDTELEKLVDILVKGNCYTWARSLVLNSSQTSAVK